MEGYYPAYKKEFAETHNALLTTEEKVTASIREEIIQDSERMNTTNLYFSIAITILAITAALLVSASISFQIKRIKENVDEITKGNLEIQLEKSSLSEIRGLSDSLSRILATMKLAILRTGLSKAELGIGEAIKAKEKIGVLK